MKGTEITEGITFIVGKVTLGEANKYQNCSFGSSIFSKSLKMNNIEKKQGYKKVSCPFCSSTNIIKRGKNREHKINKTFKSK